MGMTESIKNQIESITDLGTLKRLFALSLQKSFELESNGKIQKQIMAVQEEQIALQKQSIAALQEQIVVLKSKGE